MNLKRLLGFGAMLLGFLIPFRSAYLNIEEMNNTMGLISFLACMVLLFAGYALVDSSYTKPTANNKDTQH